jgi:hypothetical protein
MEGSRSVPEDAAAAQVPITYKASDNLGVAVEGSRSVLEAAAAAQVPITYTASESLGGHALAVQAAARLSVEMALAALVALSAAWAYELTTVQLIRRFGHGAWEEAPLYGFDYVHRAVVIAYQEPFTLSRRARESNLVSLLLVGVLLCSFPLAYMQYLGTSRRAVGAMVCVIALSYSTLELGFVVLGVPLFYQYYVVFGFMWLYAVLRVLCPRGSAVPRQALRQMLVISIGNILCANVARPRNDVERFFTTVLVLNILREVARFFVKRGGYYLTVAEFPGSHLVNRDAAVLLVVAPHISAALMFRLELSSFESEVWSVGTVAAQAVLEIVGRLTVVQRDAWINRWARRLFGRRGGRRNTRLVMIATSASVAPSALAKQFTERTAAANNRRAVIAEYDSRVILVEMISEYAGTSRHSVDL